VVDRRHVSAACQRIGHPRTILRITRTSTNPSHLLRGTTKPMIAIAKLPQDENGTQEMTALAAAGLSIDTEKELGPAGFQEVEVFFCIVLLRG
jgi:hypothetical protein